MNKIANNKSYYISDKNVLDELKVFYGGKNGESSVKKSGKAVS